MQNIKIGLEKPYTRSDEPPSTITTVNLSVDFDTQKDALLFHVELVQMLCQFAGYAP